MYCVHCGAENPEGAKFCHSCGQPVALTRRPAWPIAASNSRQEVRAGPETPAPAFEENRTAVQVKEKAADTASPEEIRERQIYREVFRKAREQEKQTETTARSAREKTVSRTPAADLPSRPSEQTPARAVTSKPIPPVPKPVSQQAETPVQKKPAELVQPAQESHQMPKAAAQTKPVQTVKATLSQILPKPPAEISKKEPENRFQKPVSRPEVRPSKKPTGGCPPFSVGFLIRNLILSSLLYLIGILRNHLIALSKRHKEKAARRAVVQEARAAEQRLLKDSRKQKSQDRQVQKQKKREAARQKVRERQEKRASCGDDKGRAKEAAKEKARQERLTRAQASDSAHNSSVKTFEKAAAQTFARDGKADIPDVSKTQSAAQKEKTAPTVQKTEKAKAPKKTFEITRLPILNLPHQIKIKAEKKAAAAKPAAPDMTPTELLDILFSPSSDEDPASWGEQPENLEKHRSSNIDAKKVGLIILVLAIGAVLIYVTAKFLYNP